MLGSLILYLKGMRIMMFQLSGFFFKDFPSGRRVQDQGVSPNPATPGQYSLAQFWGPEYPG